MEEYALIFRHPDGQAVASPAQIQQWMQQTSDWIRGIATQGKFSSGTGLSFEDSRVVRPHNVVNNGAFGAGKRWAATSS